jgi:hypothetical protein
MSTANINITSVINPIDHSVEIKAELDDTHTDDITLAWGRKAMQYIDQYLNNPVEPINADLAMIDCGTTIKISNVEEYTEVDEWGDKFYEEGDPMQIAIDLCTHGNEYLIGGFATPSFALANTITDALKVAARSVGQGA